MFSPELLLYLIPLVLLFAAVWVTSQFLVKKRPWKLIAAVSAFAVSVAMALYVVPLWIYQIQREDLPETLLKKVDLSVMTLEQLEKLEFDIRETAPEDRYQYVYKSDAGHGPENYFYIKFQYPLKGVKLEEMTDVRYKKAYEDFYYTSIKSGYVDTVVCYIIEIVSQDGRLLCLEGQFEDKKQEHYTDMNAYLEKLLKEFAE